MILSVFSIQTLDLWYVHSTRNLSYQKRALHLKRPFLCCFSGLPILRQYHLQPATWAGQFPRLLFSLPSPTFNSFTMSSWYNYLCLSQIHLYLYIPTAVTQDHILFISHLANHMASIPLPSFSPFSILFQSVFIKCIPNISFSCLELFNDYLHTSQIKPYYLAWDIGPSCARPLLSSPGYLHLPYSLNLQGCWSSWNSLNVCSHISICVFYTSAWNDFPFPSLLFRCFNEVKIKGKCIVFTKKSLNSNHSLEWSRYFLITPSYIPPSSN